jgi:MoaA/NifB/PqqE/SkfB family radical SAM enzyme
MTADDWRSVIGQAAGLGVAMVQFIGGEPTMHPRFTELMEHAIGAGLAVEVYTNLVHVRDEWWPLFSGANVSLATSYYSDTVREHEAITGRRGSHARTRANIAEAVRRGIQLRTGIIGVADGQRVAAARAELEAMGVTSIGIDYLRHVGRGAGSREPDVSQLCGNCGRGSAAISPDGDVWPCVFSRWMDVGNVRRTPLAEILAGRPMREATAMIGNGVGRPSMCVPHSCNPNRPCRPEAGDGCGPSGCRPNR